MISLTIAPAPVGRIAPLLLASFGLSTRERDVLALLIRGLGSEQIARQLFISRHTVRDHTKAIFAKAHVSSRPELVARVLATAEATLG
jgi:DNA-binding CsgD family transcriptional regulator